MPINAEGDAAATVTMTCHVRSTEMTRNLKAEPGKRLEIVDLRRSIRLYLVSAFTLHLVWEVLQLPLYTIW